MLKVFNTYEFTVTCLKDSRKGAAKASFSVIDFEIPVLYVDFSGGMQQRLINPNELLEFSIKLPS